MSGKAEGNTSFDIFMEKIMACVRIVNDASRAIGSTQILDDTSELWKNYKSALDDLQDTIKYGQKSGNGVQSVKNCTAELLYDEKPNGDGDKSPLCIVGVRLRGWVKTSQLAEGGNSSVSSSSSSTGGCGRVIVNGIVLY